MNDAERKIYMFLCIAGREAEAIKYREACERHISEVGGTNLGQPDNDCIDGMTNLEKIYEAHPDWPRHIRHGEDTGVAFSPCWTERLPRCTGSLVVSVLALIIKQQLFAFFQ